MLAPAGSFAFSATSAIQSAPYHKESNSRDERHSLGLWLTSDGSGDCLAGRGAELESADAELAFLDHDNTARFADSKPVVERAVRFA